MEQTNEVVVQPLLDGQQKKGCKQGEYLPSTYCNKVSCLILYKHQKCVFYFNQIYKVI